MQTKTFTNILSTKHLGNALVEYDHFFNKVVIQGDEHNNDISPAYNEILFAINQHFISSDHLIIIFNLSSIGVRSIKAVLNILRVLSYSIQSGKYVRVNWFYQAGNMEMIETGKDLSSIYNLDFKMIPIGR